MKYFYFLYIYVLQVQLANNCIVSHIITSIQYITIAKLISIFYGVPHLPITYI